MAGCCPKESQACELGKNVPLAFECLQSTAIPSVRTPVPAQLGGFRIRAFVRVLVSPPQQSAPKNSPVGHELSVAAVLRR